MNAAKDDAKDVQKQNENLNKERRAMETHIHKLNEQVEKT